jgi:hypothetical protein
MGEIDALDGRPDVCCFVRRDPSAIKIAGKLSQCFEKQFSILHGVL